MRALAAAIGVAPSAPYGHFKNREEVLALLVAEGSADLAARYQAASESAGSATDRLELACLAYLSFAQDNPALFTLMFTNIDWEVGLRALIAQAMVAYAIFEKLVAATMPGAGPIDVNAATVATWSAIHGMSLLKLNGRLERRYVAGQTDLNVIRTVLQKAAGPVPGRPIEAETDTAAPTSAAAI